MRFIFLALIACISVQSAELELQPGTTLVLPSAKESAPLLAKRDAYFERMTPFDRAARMKTEKAPSIEEFAAHAGAQALEFTSDEVTKISAAAKTIGIALAPLKLSLPAKITLIKTTGLEDIDAPFCRGPIIIAPQSLTTQPVERLTDVLIHELFHVFSSHNADLHPKLYGLLGYQQCPEIELPPAIDARRFTNPDCMSMNFLLAAKHEDREINVIPAMLAKSATFDAALKAPVFAQVDFVLLEATVANGKTVLATKDGSPVIRQATTVPGFLKAMARNTNYIWHPEEVLADNFVRALRPGKKLNAPELPGKLLEVMQSARGK
jgi:hypothetical protein